MMGGSGGGGGGGGIDMFIGQAFGFFDKDKSGYIDGMEAKAAVDRVLGLAGIKNIPQSGIDSTFNKVAGPDQRLTKAEFTALIHRLLASHGQAA